MLSERQIGYVTRATSLLSAAAQPAFRQQVATLLGYAEHPLHESTLLDLMRPLLAEHGVSIGEVLPPPKREYAHLERINRHAITSPVF
jgi:hypothetical protein